MNGSPFDYGRTLIALSDMRGNFVAVIVTLAIGAVALRAAAPAADMARPRRWLSFTALACGPIAALLYMIADILWISPYNYRKAQDYVDSLQAALVIGLLGGVIGAVAIWWAECAVCHCQRKRRPRGEDNHSLDSASDFTPAKPTLTENTR